jgi:hypothetical protein
MIMGLDTVSAMATTTTTDPALRCRCCDHPVGSNGNDWRCKQGCRCTMRGCVLDTAARSVVERRTPTRVYGATITPRDRAAQGNQPAWAQAVTRLEKEYVALCGMWAGKPTQPVLRVALEMERP